MKTQEQIRQLRNILDALVIAEKYDNDAKEDAYDTELKKVHEISKDNIIEALNKAIGKNIKRKNVAMYVFSELYDLPNIDKIFIELLSSSEPENRNIIIQTIGLRKMKNFIHVLNLHFETETDRFCKEQVIYTLGEFADESSLPIFLNLAENKEQEYKWRLVWAFKNFARLEGKPYLERIFNDKTQDKSDKVVAAWGLVKIGDTKYYDYLLKMLNDPDIQTAKSYSPGQSMRAAQAICDINNWDFIWEKDFVDIVRDKIKNVSQHRSGAIWAFHFVRQFFYKFKIRLHNIYGRKKKTKNKL